MEDDNEVSHPVEQRVPGPESSYGGYGQPQTQPVPPYAAPFPLTETPNEMMGRVILGFVMILIGWIITSLNIVSDSGDASRWLTASGMILRWIGIVIIAISMLQGALQRNWYSDMVRLGILIAVGLFIIGI